jgi:ABC-type phosphate/phosphonate transport system substrate-binding protein
MIRGIQSMAALATMLWAAVALAAEPFVLVVMDPLSKPLSCDCVRGYAQRDYNLLATHLETTLQRPVKVVWFESLEKALQETAGRADLVIGKHSVVLADAKVTGKKLQPLMQLTGKQGTVTQRGLIVVRRDDPATELKDLQGYRLLLGPAEAEEKSSAAIQSLAAAGVENSAPRETFGACSEAAAALLKLPPDVKAAAVISSYAQPLLEGCGSIKKDDLRVVGETAEVPFVTAFVSQELSEQRVAELREALLLVSTKVELLNGLETLLGFLPWEEASATNAGEKKKDEHQLRSLTELAASNRWPQFRGAARDGRVAWLPDRLPDADHDLLWSVTLPSDGVGGVMVAESIVVVSGRDALDQRDLFLGLDLASGESKWEYQYPADAKLDYGNSPRATPTFAHGVLVTLGATGIVSGLDLASGVPLWTVDLTTRFNVPLPTWGFSGSPLVVGELVIIQVAEDPSLVALDLYSGAVKWQVSEKLEAATYASLMLLPDGEQLTGVGKQRYFIRRIHDGALVCSAMPAYGGDFGVPSPVIVPGGIVFSSENNGIQLFSWHPPPAAPQSIVHDLLLPDTHTPVAVGNRLLVAHQGVHCLDIDGGLQELWRVEGAAPHGYASIIATDSRAVIVSESGQLTLLGIDGAAPQVLDQRQLSDKKIKLLAHPAIDRDKWIIRVGYEVRCYRL